MKKMLLTVCLITIAAGFVYAQGKNGAVQDSKENKTVIQNEEKKDDIQSINIKIVERKVKKQPSVVKSGKVRIKEGYEKEVGKLEFLDKNGKVKKVLTGGSRKEIDRGYKRRTIMMNSKEDKIVISNMEVTENNEEIVYKTGWKWQVKNDVEILNDMGDVVGGKKELDCNVVGISESGDKFLCFKINPDDADDVSRSSDIDLGKMANISIYSKDGNLLFSKNSPSDGFNDPKLSPNGEWIVVKSYGPNFEIYVYGVNGEEFIVPDIKVKDFSSWTYDGINDAGEIEYIVWDAGKIAGKYLYVPKDSVLAKVVEE